MRKWIAALAIVCSLAGPAVGQISGEYRPTINDSLRYQPTLDQINQRISSRIAALPKENRQYFTEIYKERGESIGSYFRQKQLYCNSDAQVYLHQLLQEVVRQNPALQQDSIYLFFVNTENPNAASIGERMLVFHTGLFRRLANESQAAFVLCHELAHLQLAHSDTQLETLVNTLYGDEMQARLKEIKRSQYMRNDQLQQLAKQLTINRSRHSRYKESEADSMALVYLRNTRFDAREAVGALQVLDSVDNDAFATSEVLPAQFNGTDYPFNAAWTKAEEGLLGGHAKLDENKPLEDSLKTHPDCSVRIVRLRQQLGGYQPAGGAVLNPVNGSYFQTLRNTLWLDNLEYYCQQKKLDRALYHALQYVNTHPQQASTAVTVIGRSFNSLYDAQKARHRNDVAALPSPGNAPAYNQFLQFLQNLDADDIAAINKQFLSRYQAQLGSDAAFAKALAESRRRQ